MEAVDTG